MDDKLKKVISSLKNDGKELFENADKQVVVCEEEKEDPEVVKRIQEVRAHTEKIAYYFAALVYNILFEVKSKRGEIKQVNELLGKLSTGTNDTELSHYEIDENGLTIYLNYSNEYFADRSGFGDYSLDRDNDLDAKYLEELLNSCGIMIKRETAHKTTSCHSLLDYDMVTITYLRPEKVKKGGRNK